MLAIGTAFAWDCWGRCRYLLLGAFAYLLVVEGMICWAPVGTFNTTIIYYLTIPCWFANPFLIGWSEYLEQGDLAVRASGYPRRLFTLPVPTWLLVGWPMALGCSAFGAWWLLLCGLLQRGEQPVPLFWVAGFGMGLVAWVQALVWSPFPLSYLRIILLVVVFASVFSVGTVIGYLSAAPPAVLLSGSAAMLVTGYLVALAGVTRARCGDVPVWHWPVFRRRLVEAAPPFAGAIEALWWLEWRRKWFYLPLLLALPLLPMLVLTIFVSAERLHHFQASAFLFALYLYPLMMAAAAGASLGNYHPWAREVAPIPAFLAARPVTTATLLGVKFRLVTRSLWNGWLMDAFFLVTLLPLSPAGRMLLGWGRALVEQEPTRGTASLVLLLLALPALTWKEALSHLWTSLSGRNWVTIATTVVEGSALTAVGATSLWAIPYPEAHAILLALVPWAVAVGLGLKLGLGLLVMRALLRNELLAPRSLARYAALWLGAAAALIGLIYWLLPEEVYSPPVASAAAVLVFLPLVRIGLAPLALDWNRHR